jgi:hypothetical protein
MREDRDQNSEGHVEQSSEGHVEHTEDDVEGHVLTPQNSEG